MEDVKAQKRDARTQETREASFKRIRGDFVRVPCRMTSGLEKSDIRVESLRASMPETSHRNSGRIRACEAEDTAINDQRGLRRPFKGGIEIGGLLLCRIPEEYLKQREEYFARQNQAQMESVDQNYMRENHPHMRKFSERSTEVTFGSGSK